MRGVCVCVWFKEKNRREREKEIESKVLSSWGDIWAFSRPGRSSHFGGCGLLVLLLPLPLVLVLRVLVARGRSADCRELRGARGHGAREGESPPLVTAAKRQDFPHRVHREMGADPCPQTEAGPMPPPAWCGGTRRLEVLSNYLFSSFFFFSSILMKMMKWLWKWLWEWENLVTLVWNCWILFFFFIFMN